MVSTVTVCMWGNSLQACRDERPYSPFSHQHHGLWRLLLQANEGKSGFPPHPLLVCVKVGNSFSVMFAIGEQLFSESFLSH